MSKFFLLVVLFIFPVRAVCGCTLSEVDNIENEVCEQIKINVTFIGDSITTGSYPWIFQSMLKNYIGPSVVNVSVVAKSGATFYDMKNKIYKVLENPKTENVVMFLGINDCFNFSNSGVPVGNKLEYMVEEFYKVAEFARKNGVQLFIVLPHMWRKYADKYSLDPVGAVECTFALRSGIILGEYDSFVAGRLSGARIVDLWHYCVDTNDDIFTGKDGLHFDYDGNLKLAEILSLDYNWIPDYFLWEEYLGC